MTDLHYLQLLSRTYPTALAASAEIINLNAICQLPKGTEYFFSDLHGEYDAFSYLLSSASGILRDKIENLFSRSVSERDREELAMLIYNPKDVLAQVRERLPQQEHDAWCQIVIYRLVQVCKTVSSKYTRSKVRKKSPPISPISLMSFFTLMMRIIKSVTMQRSFAQLSPPEPPMPLLPSFVY